MPEQIFSNFSALAALGGLGVLVALFVLLLVVWSIAWKGYALWISAQEHNKLWFIILLLINTAGILEIIYIYLISKRGKECIVNWKAKRALKKTSKEQKSEEVVINEIPTTNAEPLKVEPTHDSHHHSHSEEKTN